MDRVIGVTDLQRKFRPIFDKVAKEGQSYILTRGNQPEAALVPYEDFVRLQKLQENQIISRFDQVLARMSQENAKYTEREVETDLQAAAEELHVRS